MALLAPPFVDFVLYEGLASLPPFNPDLDRADAPYLLPTEIAQMRRMIFDSDCLVIASPEYAHGVSGSLKNALDWLVGSVEFPSKHVAVINTSARAKHADAQLREILTTMSAKIIRRASITIPIASVLRGKGAMEIASDLASSTRLRISLTAIVEAIAGDDQGPSDSGQS